MASGARQRLGDFDTPPPLPIAASVTELESVDQAVTRVLAALARRMHLPARSLKR